MSKQLFSLVSDKDKEIFFNYFYSKLVEIEPKVSKDDIDKIFNEGCYQKGSFFSGNLDLNNLKVDSISKIIQFFLEDYKNLSNFIQDKERELSSIFRKDRESKLNISHSFTRMSEFLKAYTKIVLDGTAGEKELSACHEYLIKGFRILELEMIELKESLLSSLSEDKELIIKNLIINIDVLTEKCPDLMKRIVGDSLSEEVSKKIIAEFVYSKLSLNQLEYIKGHVTAVTSKILAELE